MAQDNTVEYYSPKELKEILKRIKKIIEILNKKEVISLYESGICSHKFSYDQIVPSTFKEDIIISLLVFAVYYFDSSESEDKNKSIGDILSHSSEPEYKGTVWFVARMAINDGIGPKDVLELLQRNESIRNRLIEVFACEMYKKEGNELYTSKEVQKCLERLRKPK